MSDPTERAHLWTTAQPVNLLAQRSKQGPEDVTFNIASGEYVLALPDDMTPREGVMLQLFIVSMSAGGRPSMERFGVERLFRRKDAA